MIVERLWVKAWTDSLETMTRIFRADFIGLPSTLGQERILECWGGSEAGRIDELCFWVRQPGHLDPFTFYFFADERFRSPQAEETTISLVVTVASEPLTRIRLLTVHDSTNWVIMTPAKQLSRLERHFCKTLTKRGRIPRGRTPLANGQLPEGMFPIPSSPFERRWENAL